MSGSGQQSAMALIAGVGLSVLLIVMEYRTHRISLWVDIPEMPGFVVAIFTVGVHGSMKPFHVVMGTINAIFYGFLAFSVMNWIAWLRNQR